MSANIGDSRKAATTNGSSIIARRVKVHIQLASVFLAIIPSFRPFIIVETCSYVDVTFMSLPTAGYDIPLNWATLWYWIFLVSFMWRCFIDLGAELILPNAL
jgi:hypothetical protein